MHELSSDEYWVGKEMLIDSEGFKRLSKQTRARDDILKLDSVNELSESEFNAVLAQLLHTRLSHRLAKDTDEVNPYNGNTSDNYDPHALAPKSSRD